MGRFYLTTVNRGPNAILVMLFALPTRLKLLVSSKKRRGSILSARERAKCQVFILAALNFDPGAGLVHKQRNNPYLQLSQCLL
jgi:hypothetical protein